MTQTRLAVDHDVARLTDQLPLYPFRHPPRIRPRDFNLEHQKQVLFHPSRIRSRRVLHPTKFQHKQALECSESQRYDGHVGQEQRPGQRSPQCQADPGPVQREVPVPMGFPERGAFHRRIQTVHFFVGFLSPPLLT